MRRISKAGLRRKIGWRGDVPWRELARRVWQELWADNVFGRSAQLSYFFLLSLFPLLIILTVLLGFITQGAQVQEDLLNYFSRIMPLSAFVLVRDTLNEITASAGPGKLSIGILATLWAASNGMGAIIGGLNKAYDIEEGRPWWKSRLLALALTMALAAFSILALVLALYGGRIGDLVARRAGLGDTFQTGWDLLQWPLVILFMWITFTMLYRIAPYLEEQKWRWTIPGALLGVGLWILVTSGFRLYLGNFGGYNKVYGSLGALIVLLLWFYGTGAAILVGAELNAELEHAAAQSGDPEAKLPGERAPGEAG